MEATASARNRLPQLAKYEVVEELGHGGMATVYRARDRRLDREVAIKVIHPHLRDSAEVVARFDAEARAVAKLRHPNIVEVFDVSEPDEPEQYLVSELLRGTTLRKLLHGSGPMPPEVAAAIALELLAAVGHANASGIIHRDVKPENVLIEHKPEGTARDAEPLKPGRGIDSGRPAPPSGGERVVVKLTDFGIAKLLDAQGVTSTGQVLGSPAHMAPEQIEGGEVDARADVFGTGVVLYECMVGHLPFEGNNPAQVLRRVLDGQYPEAVGERAVVGARWSALLDRALAHDPAARFADAPAMRDAILDELGRLGVPTPRRLVEQWLDHPAELEADHAKRMIEKLCALGAEERRGGDVIAASADYNRALAHAPHDPALLRLVAGMNRVQARARLLRGSSAALALMLGLGGVAYGVGRALRPSTAPTATSSTASPLAPSVSQAAPPSPSASAPGAPRASTTAVLVPVPRPAAPAPSARPVERQVRVDLTPPMGVTLVLDDGPSRTIGTGQALAVDGKSHTLTFACPVCTSATREVPGGDHDETLVVRLSIKPATLLISGDATRTYQLVEHPEVPVRVGANSVPVGSEFDRATVRQIESGTTVAVRLHAAHTVEATFP